MVQIIKETEKSPSFLQKLVGGFVQGIPAGVEKYESLKTKKATNEAYKKLGIPEGTPLELAKTYLAESLKGKQQENKTAQELVANRKILRGIEKERGLEEGALEDFVSDPKTAEQVTRPVKEPKQALTEKSVPTEISRKMNKIIVDNPKASSDKLRLLMDEEGIPPVYSNPYTENRRRTEEATGKATEARKNALRMETLPIRTEIAKKAQAAEKGIQNKEQLMQLIEQGDLNNPTFAALAEALPLNLGKRLLSNDTTEYKAGLVEEFGDLRNIFQGQTRIKEIELLENKIADIYLTDDQKRAVLRSRLNALRADIIRAEAAAELEDSEDLGVLQFNAELEKKAKPKLDALFSQILDDQKSIIANAESRKSKDLPLDPKDPDDLAILQQILKEARGDKQEARKIAKKKGYSF